ncbi:hypothetical protein XENOCAPTIV_004380 [Xenoophorus captivus]|uniref:Uncharacterized protein n=1 Tax=Xenoophorus captivus TaxID=1517983 RepID=A0ABV0QCN4_9TELE
MPQMPGHGSSQGGSDGPMHELEHFAVVCKRKQAMSSRESPLRGRAATLGDASAVFREAGGCAGTGTPQSRRKRPWLERLSRQELNSLRAEVEQLKALLKAPDPSPAFQAAAAWESGEDLEDDGISVRSSESEFQSLEDQGDPFPDPRGREVDPPSMERNDGSGNSLRSSVSSDPGEEPCPLRAIILAALARVVLDNAPAARPTANPFFRWTPAAPPFAVPPSPAFLEEVQRFLRFCPRAT